MVSGYGIYQYFWGFEQLYNYVFYSGSDEIFKTPALTTIESERVFSTLALPGTLWGFLLMALPIHGILWKKRFLLDIWSVRSCGRRPHHPKSKTNPRARGNTAGNLSRPRPAWYSFLFHERADDRECQSIYFAVQKLDWRMEYFCGESHGYGLEYVCRRLSPIHAAWLKRNSVCA
jgi:hypothetical protein